MLLSRPKIALLVLVVLSSFWFLTLALVLVLAFWSLTEVCQPVVVGLLVTKLLNCAILYIS